MDNYGRIMLTPIENNRMQNNEQLRIQLWVFFGTSIIEEIQKWRLTEKLIIQKIIKTRGESFAKTYHEKNGSDYRFLNSTPMEGSQDKSLERKKEISIKSQSWRNLRKR